MKIKQAKLSGAGVYLGALATTTIVAGSALVIPNVAADNSIVDTVQVTVQPSCTLGGEGGFYSVELLNGTKNENIGSTDITAYCNDSNGFGIYAVGASDDHEGDTYMHHDTDSTHDFNTGTTFSGATSAWAMKLAATVGTYTPNISTGFDSFHTVPTQYTMVAYRNAGTDKETDTDAEGATITTTYGVYVSGTQAPGTYTGKVRYALIHPYSNTNLVSLEKALTDATAPTKTVGGKTYFTMQGMTSGICANANIVGTASRLKMVDSRDDHIYLVAKLADNRCWLLDNLALDLTASGASTNIDATNTNADTASLNALFGVATRDASTDPDGNLATAGVADWTSSYSFSAPLVNITDKDVVPQGSYDPLAAEALAGSWKVGDYYNFCAASAGSYCYGDGTSEGSPSGNASSDICPSGWRMPTGGASGEYRAVYNEYSGTDGTGVGSKYAIFRKALRLPLAGIFNNGSVNDQAISGYFWSSTYGADNYSKYMYTLGAGISAVTPQQAYYSRKLGFSVRCIAK